MTQRYDQIGRLEAGGWAVASGTVEAAVSVDVSSELSGRIADVFVNFNDSVKAGQPIAQIDQAINAIVMLQDFLRQDMYTPVNLQQSLLDLETLFPQAGS